MNFRSCNFPTGKDAMFFLESLILLGRRSCGRWRLGRLGGLLLGLGRQFVAQFDGEPVARVVFS